ncbi:hypothetical protein [Sphingomonas prati]|uniref:Uncharacterized protein n=1 Tax=Sphingomonas prati TaxID=1843237 RepID=A0A7W9BQV4_9SPHN|nr:hypothetical protein [Sphingomonas prati]MBB5728289.1 hypothetical protein [Sphingomonas prati]GGE74988.1 hypothetical protein GCM10011404_04380 [Sphingomonas prati]
MATQFKHADFTQTAAPRPNIRVAYTDGLTTTAVNRALAASPAAIRDATLDELDTDTSLRGLLARRNAIIELMDHEDLTDARQSELFSVVHVCEDKVLKTKAGTVDDAVVKMIAALQVAAEGHELGEGEAAQAVAEARKHFGIGYVQDHHGLMPASPTGAIAVAPWIDAGPRLDETPGSLAAAVRDDTDGAVPLPPLPVGITDAMADLFQAYFAAYFSHAEEAGDEVVGAADNVRLFPAMTVPDLAAKLLVAVHHAHPRSTPDGWLAVDPADFQCTQAGEMMLSALTDALRLAESGGPTGTRTPTDTSMRRTWDRNLAAYRVANAAFSAANAPFACMHPADPGYAAAEAAVDLPMAADTAAENVLFVTPAPDLAAARIKFGIAVDANVHTDEVRSLLDDLERFERAYAPLQVSDNEQGAWPAVLASFVAAKTAERIYDETTYLPAFARYAANEADIPGDIEERSDALMNARFAAEEALMSVPAPDAAAFAFKYLVAYADGREAHQWDAALAAEAARFVPYFPREAARA